MTRAISGAACVLLVLANLMSQAPEDNPAQDEDQQRRLENRAYCKKLNAFEKAVAQARPEKVQATRETLRGVRARLGVAKNDRDREQVTEQIAKIEKHIENLQRDDFLVIPSFEFRRAAVGVIGKPMSEFGLGRTLVSRVEDGRPSQEIWTCNGHRAVHDGKKLRPAVPQLESVVVVHRLPTARHVDQNREVFEVVKLGTVTSAGQRKRQVVLQQLDAHELWSDVLALRGQRDAKKPAGKKPAK